MTEPPRCLNCGYVLFGLPRGRCPECGVGFDPNNPATFSSKPLFDRVKFWLPAFLTAVGGGIVLYVVLILLAGWGWAVTISAPFALGAAIGYSCRVRVFAIVLLALTALGIVVCALFTLSFVGIFCGLMLAGVSFGPLLIGAGVGALLRRRLKRSEFTQRWYLPTLMLAITAGLGLVERITHRPYSVESVATSVEMPVSANRAWNAVMFFEEVHHQPPWLLRLGLPRPLYTRGSTAHVGDTKTCVYTRGHLTKCVTGREVGRRLAFDVIEQDRIENHSVRLTEGSFDLQPMAADQTHVELTTRYEPKLGPRWIWRPAERLAVQTMHRHVLEGMRQKAMESP